MLESLLDSVCLEASGVGCLNLWGSYFSLSSGHSCTFYRLSVTCLQGSSGCNWCSKVVASVLNAFLSLMELCALVNCFCLDLNFSLFTSSVRVFAETRFWMQICSSSSHITSKLSIITLGEFVRTTECATPITLFWLISCWSEASPLHVLKR